MFSSPECAVPRLIQYAPFQTSSFTELHAFKVHPTLLFLFVVWQHFRGVISQLFVFIYPLEGILITSDIVIMNKADTNVSVWTNVLNVLGQHPEHDGSIIW